MSITDFDVQALVGPQFRALADALTAEPPSIANAESLCEGWAVRHVIAHMTMAARYDEPAFTAELQSVGYDFNALSERVARRDGALPFEELLSNLRSDSMAAWAPPGGGAAGALSHVVIHGLDITAACGLRRTADDEATVLVLDSLTAGGVAAHFGTDPTGWRLSATDVAWDYGDGKPLAANADDLVLALTGRSRPGIELRAS